MYTPNTHKHTQSDVAKRKHVQFIEYSMRVTAHR